MFILVEEKVLTLLLGMILYFQIELTAHFFYSISNESLKFFINLSKNINGLKIFVGTFEEMIFKHKPNRVFYKEHPTNLKYTGIEDKRESYFSQDNLYPSFFKFWNANQKNIKKLFSESWVR